MRQEELGRHWDALTAGERVGGHGLFANLLHGTALLRTGAISVGGAGGTWIGNNSHELVST